MAKIMTIRPPDRLHDLLRQSAKSKGLTLNALVLQILWDWLKNSENKSA